MHNPKYVFEKGGKWGGEEVENNPSELADAMQVRGIMQ